MTRQRIFLKAVLKLLFSAADWARALIILFPMESYFGPERDKSPPAGFYRFHTIVKNNGNILARCYIVAYCEIKGYLFYVEFCSNFGYWAHLNKTATQSILRFKWSQNPIKKAPSPLSCICRNQRKALHTHHQLIGVHKNKTIT